MKLSLFRRHAERRGMPWKRLMQWHAALAEHGERVPHSTRMEAHFLLSGATGDRAHLAEAKRLLDFAVEHSPADCRGSMLANARLHREIAAAAVAHGI